MFSSHSDADFPMTAQTGVLVFVDLAFYVSPSRKRQLSQKALALNTYGCGAIGTKLYLGSLS